MLYNFCNLSQKRGNVAVKKLLCALIVVVVVASCAAAETLQTVGFLSRLNISEEEFSNMLRKSQRAGSWRKLSGKHDLTNVKFYDSLTMMLLALDRNEIDEVSLPQIVSEYLVKTVPEYDISCITQTKASMGLAFGFREDNQALAEKVNEALKAMKADHTLAELQGVYLYDRGKKTAAKFSTFKGAETLTVAITGDMPPLDYVDEAGRPAGFNAALLAELGRRLRMNVKLLNVESGARSSALASGRADVVFWFETAEGGSWPYDASEGVLLSEPYYSWSKFLHIRRK